MAVEIALDDEEVRDRMKAMAPLQQIQAQPMAQRKPGAAEQFGNMAKQRAMEKTLDFGTDKVMGMFNPAPAAAKTTTMSSVANPLMKSGVDAGIANTMAKNAVANAGTGAAAGAGMTGLTAAMPYLGAGLLAGKAFGLFNSGGMVGPLAKIEYKSKGGDVYKLSYGGPISKGA